MIKRDRLYFDIETSPNIGVFWNAGYRQTIDYHNIIKERSIICICYKWEGEKKIHSLTWDKNQSDKKMLTEFIKVANKADELVGHNGDKFDMAFIRTRCLFHRIPMFPKYVTIDTLKISRSQFRFNSNRLDYIGQFLGVGKKIDTDFSLWKDVLLNKNPKALKNMVDYCKNDVVILESVFTELKAHTVNKTHHGVMHGNGRWSCPECGSHRLYLKTTRTTAQGFERFLYYCQDCRRHCTKNTRLPNVA